MPSALLPGPVGPGQPVRFLGPYMSHAELSGSKLVIDPARPVGRERVPAYSAGDVDQVPGRGCSAAAASSTSSGRAQSSDPPRPGATIRSVVGIRLVLLSFPPFPPPSSSPPPPLPLPPPPSSPPSPPPPPPPPPPPLRVAPRSGGGFGRRGQDGDGHIDRGEVETPGKHGEHGVARVAGRFLTEALGEGRAEQRAEAWLAEYGGVGRGMVVENEVEQRLRREAGEASGRLLGVRGDGRDELAHQLGSFPVIAGWATSSIGETSTRAARRPGERCRQRGRSALSSRRRAWGRREPRSADAGDHPHSPGSCPRPGRNGRARVCRC